MSSRHAIFLTGRRELRERLRSRAFRVSTGVQVLLVVGAVVLSGVLGGDDTTTFDVGVVGPQARAVGKAAQTRQRSIDATVKVRRLPSVAAARRAVADGDVDAALSGRSVVASADPEDALIGLLQGASASVRGSAILDRSGVPPGRARAALAPPALAVDSVAGEDQGKGLAFAATLLLYIAILTFGYTVSSGVVEEKSSRVVEIVVSAIRPLDLLAGKVFGIGILGLGQVLAIAAAGLGTALAIGKVDLPSSTATTAAVVVVFWLLGYAFYACAYAAAGVLVSRQEDSQTTTAPVFGFAIAGYFAALAVLDKPDGPLAVVCSLIPPIAPMVVPARAARDALPAWQLGLSFVLTLAAVVVAMRLAARIYQRSILRVGAPVKLREALRRAG